jgi:hypothetical protein
MDPGQKRESDNTGIATQAKTDGRELTPPPSLLASSVALADRLVGAHHATDFEPPRHSQDEVMHIVREVSQSVSRRQVRVPGEARY